MGFSIFASRPVASDEKKSHGPGLRLLRPIPLTIASAALLSLAVVVAAAMFLSDLRYREIANSERTLSNTASIVSGQVESVLKAAETVEKQLIETFSSTGVFNSEDDFVNELSNYGTHSELRNRVSGMQYVGAIAFLNSEGRVINLSRQWPVPNINASDREFFKVFKSNPNLTSFLSEPIQNRATGSWVMQLAHKLSGPDGKFIGVITAAVELTALQNGLSGLSFEAGSGLSIFYTDGRLLVRVPQAASLVGQKATNAPILTLVLKDDHGSGVFTGALDGQPRVMAASRVGNYPIVVGATKLLSIALVSWKRTATYVISLAALINIAIGAGAFLFIRVLKNYRTRLKTRAQQEKTEELLAKTGHYNVALNNMSQGLLMFDASARIVVCNDRYVEMFDLSPEVVRPGLTLLELMQHRKETGSFKGEPEDYSAQIMREVHGNEVVSYALETSDGRHIQVTNRPMDRGGWVSTHEDVTEKKRREVSFKLLFDENPVPMFIYDCDTLRFLSANETAVKHYGYSREQFLGMTATELRPAEEHERFLSRRIAPINKDSTEGQWKHLKADGSIIHVATYGRSLNYENRKARLVAIHDITKSKLAENELHRTKKFIDAVIEHMPLPIIVKNVAGLAADARESRFTLFNRAYEDLTGDSRHRLIGKTAHENYPKERADLIVQSDNSALLCDDVVTTTEHTITTAHNGPRLVVATKTVIKDDKGQPEHLLTVVDDVTERRRSEQRIAYLAHVDSLTDLPNRSTFVEYLSDTLAQARETGERFAILCLDLDRFKDANDDHGHPIGDQLLRIAADRLRAVASGAFVARVGGDEFTFIVKSSLQSASAEILANHILAAFRDDFEVEGRKLQLGASIGVAVYPDNGTDEKTLMANADAALYQAKEDRGSVRFFDAGLAAMLRDHRDLQKDILIGIAQNEFVLHYQPQVKLTSNETVGLEALVRWQSPKRGFVAPGAFISVAEETKLILPLGEWILREACREAASWPRPLTIAVNISPVQFHNGNLPGLVHSILLETGLAPARLELEITEGVLINDFSRAVSILRKLKSLGVQIAMDDFGSGYSSLSYLHSFPFDKIKIDRSFIGDLENNRHSMAIVRAIITLGHNLDVPVLAEGVETNSQRQFLVHEGCDEVQGYLTGRPLPIDQYARHVGRQTTTQISCVAVAG